MLGRRFQRDHVSHGRMGDGRVLAVVQILKRCPGNSCADRRTWRSQSRRNRGVNKAATMWYDEMTIVSLSLPSDARQTTRH